MLPVVKEQMVNSLWRCRYIDLLLNNCKFCIGVGTATSWQWDVERTSLWNIQTVPSSSSPLGHCTTSSQRACSSMQTTTSASCGVTHGNNCRPSLVRGHSAQHDLNHDHGIIDIMTTQLNWSQTLDSHVGSQMCGSMFISGAYKFYRGNIYHGDRCPKNWRMIDKEIKQREEVELVIAYKGQKYIRYYCQYRPTA